MSADPGLYFNDHPPSAKEVRWLLAKYAALTGARRMIVHLHARALTGDVLLVLAERPGLAWVIEPRYPQYGLVVEEGER